MWMRGMTGMRLNCGQYESLEKNETEIKRIKDIELN
jgi:hypothetical protein